MTRREGRGRWLLRIVLACAVAVAVASMCASADAANGMTEAEGAVGDRPREAEVEVEVAVRDRPRARFHRASELGGWKKLAKKAKKGLKKAGKTVVDAGTKAADDAVDAGTKVADDAAAAAKKVADDAAAEAMKQVNSMKNELSKIEDYLSVFNKAKGNAEQVVDDVNDMIKKVGKSVDISKKIDTATSKVTEFPDVIAKKVSGFVSEVVDSIFGGAERDSRGVRRRPRSNASWKRRGRFRERLHAR